MTTMSPWRQEHPVLTSHSFFVCFSILLIPFACLRLGDFYYSNNLFKVSVEDLILQ